MTHKHSNHKRKGYLQKRLLTALRKRCVVTGTAWLILTGAPCWCCSHTVIVHVAKIVEPQEDVSLYSSHPFFAWVSVQTSQSCTHAGTPCAQRIGG
jgi:hypothetical protein